MGYDSAWQFSSYFDGLAYTNAQAQLDLNMLKGLVSLPAGFSHPSQVRARRPAMAEPPCRHH